jgi:hypothetical protein
MMKQFVKYFLGSVIIATIIYTVFIGYNVLKFVSSEESTANIADYEIKFSIADEELIELEKKFNEKQLKDNANNIVMNYDGTPTAWVIKVELQENVNFDEIENGLLENGFISFQKDSALFIGPYIDKLQLEEAKKYMFDSFSIKTNELELWKI